MALYDSAFETELMKEVKRRRDILMENLAHKGAIKNYEEYMFAIGGLLILDEILPEICEEVNKVLSEH